MGMKISEAKTLIRKIFEYNLEQALRGSSHNTYLVPMLIAQPGVGKTTCISQVSRELDVPYKVEIVAQRDAGEMAGLIMYNDAKSQAIRLRPDYLPPSPVFKDGKYTGEEGPGIFNLDELPQAMLANQNVCSQLVNEYRIGEHAVSPLWTMVATGNRPEDRSGTTPMPAHLKDRLMMVEIDVDQNEWLNYAMGAGIDYRIRAYIKERGVSHLQNFDPKVKSCPTCRSWEKASAILSLNLADNTLSHSLEAQIGPEAYEFLSWLKVEKDLPKLEDIIRDPESVPVFGSGKNVSIAYMLMCAIADAADEKNIGQFIKYMDRMKDTELVMFCFHDMLIKNKELGTHPEVRRWKRVVGANVMF